MESGSTRCRSPTARVHRGRTPSVLFTGAEAVVQSAETTAHVLAALDLQAADGATAYEWSFGDGTATGPSVAHQYSTTGTHQVQLVVSEGLCSDTVLLEEGIPGPGSMTWTSSPNVFSPNGDGINDVFTAWHPWRLLQFHAERIYDRWGLQLFEGSGAGAPWDGRARRGRGPDGVYYYVAEVGPTRYGPCPAVGILGDRHRKSTPSAGSLPPEACGPWTLPILTRALLRRLQRTVVMLRTELGMSMWTILA